MRAINILSSQGGDEIKAGELACLIADEAVGLDNIEPIVSAMVVSQPDLIEYFVVSFEDYFLKTRTPIEVKRDAPWVHAVIMGLILGELEADPQRMNITGCVSPTVLLRLAYMNGIKLDKMEDKNSSRFSSAVTRYLKQGTLVQSIAACQSEAILRRLKLALFFRKAAVVMAEKGEHTSPLFRQVVTEFTWKTNDIMMEPEVFHHHLAGMAYALEQSIPEFERSGEWTRQEKKKLGL